MGAGMEDPEDPIADRAAHDFGWLALGVVVW